MTVKRKIIYIFLIFVWLPCIIAFGVFLKVFSDHIYKTATNATAQILEENNYALELKFDNYRNLTMQLYYEESLMKILTAKTIDFEGSELIEQTLNSILNTEKDIRTVCLQVNGQIFMAGKPLLMVDEYISDMLPEVDEANGRMVCFSSRSLKDSFGHTNRYFSVARTIRQDRKPVATIWLFANESFFSTGKENGSYFKDSIKVVVDKREGENNFIYSSITNHGLLGPIVRRFSGNSGTFFEIINGEKYFIVFSKLDTASWYHAVAVPEKIALQGRQQMTSIALIAFLFLAVSLVITLIMVSKYIFRPLQSLSNKMLHVSRGELDTKMEIIYDDEIGKLSSKFNEMVAEINGLVERVKHESAQKNDAKMRALSMQISPHFMYNTLNSIKWMAVINEQENIERMTDSLIQLLMHVSKGGDDVLLLEQEIEFLDKYCYIQKVRFMNFDIFYDIAPETRGCLVPKLILQPLVENSIIHGVSKNSIPGVIAISSYKQGRDLVITVEDNGVGFDADKLLRDEECEKCVGIKNVKERIFLECGTAYKLDIQSSPGRGCKITIHLPFAQEVKYDPDTDC